MTKRWAPGTCRLLAWERGMALLDSGISDEQAEKLWEAVRHETGLETFLQVLMETTGAGLLNIPPFAVAILDERGAHVAVRGSWLVSVHTGEREIRLSGEDITTWEEKLVVGAVAAELQAPGAHERTLPLVCGIVDGDRVAWSAGTGSPSPAKPPAHEEDQGSGQDTGEAAVMITVPKRNLPAPAPDPAPGGHTTLSEPADPPPEASRAAPESPYSHLWDESEAVEPETDGRDEQRDTTGELRDGLTVADDVEIPIATFPEAHGPQVLAVFCAGGHPNPPQRIQCYQCDAPMGEQQPRLVERPQLGWLRIAGGETVPLRGPVVAGRNPRTTALPSAEPPRLIALPHRHISSNHIAFVLEGWSVLVRDLGSSNGSYLRRHGNPPVRLPENDTPLVPGDVIDLGHGVFINLDRIP